MSGWFYHVQSWIQYNITCSRGCGGNKSIKKENELASVGTTNLLNGLDQNLKRGKENEQKRKNKKLGKEWWLSLQREILLQWVGLFSKKLHFNKERFKMKVEWESREDYSQIVYSHRI